MQKNFRGKSSKPNQSIYYLGILNILHNWLYYFLLIFRAPNFLNYQSIRWDISYSISFIQKDVAFPWREHVRLGHALDLQMPDIKLFLKEPQGNTLHESHFLTWMRSLFHWMQTADFSHVRKWASGKKHLNKGKCKEVICTGVSGLLPRPGERKKASYTNYNTSRASTIPAQDIEYAELP